MKECKYCKAVVKSKSNNAKFCSIVCRDKNTFDKKQLILLEGIEGYDYIIDKWNGYATTRIYGHWFKSMHPNKTIDEYRLEFPGAKTQCDRINEKNGQFMKEDKYKELQRQRMLGAGNPNHTSNTTKEQRQSKSPFSKKFKGYNSEEDLQKFIESINYASIKKSTDLEWWIEKFNGNVTKAKKHYKERQSTFTLEKCINKHGKEEGIRVFNERQEKWLKKLYASFEKYGDGRSPQSKWVDDIKHILSENGLNITCKEKWMREPGSTKSYSYDLTIGKKIIEFNGDYWHANPSKYSPDWLHPTKKKTSNELWEYDIRKTKLAESYGYEVLTVWESDYNSNPEKTIEDCINFLNK